MAAEDLPSEFDVVLVGTGLTESVVAAACARVGQRVLHLDTRTYYASKWASFTLNALLTWIDERQEQALESPSNEVQDWSSLLQDGEEPICLSNADSASIRNVQVFCFASEGEEDEDKELQRSIEEEEEEEEKEEESKERRKDKDEDSCTESAGTTADGQPRRRQQEEEEAGDAEKAGPEPPRPLQAAGGKKMTFAHLLKEGRRFNIDLVSKLMYARGSLVDLLIKSNVSRYAEFKNVTRILTYRHGNVEQVPCSRADVFASRRLSMVEKRKLMRFLASCVEEKEEEEPEDGARTYSEFLRERQLGDNLQHFLLHSIAMVTEDTPTREGLASTRHFLRCLGRYGNTPFLFPVYGLGEIPQCFCRMCAVFGGVYCLRHPVSCLLLDKSADRCTALIDGGGRRIASSHFVLEEGFLPAQLKSAAAPTRSISRGVLITNRSILPSDQHQVSVVTIPSLEAALPAVRMVELSPATMTCAPGTYLVHLTCQSQLGSAYEDLWPVVTRMFNTEQSRDRDSRPDVLWCFYFNVDDGGAGAEPDGDRLPSNVYVCSGPDAELGHERAIKQAEAIFRKIVPDQDFCPPAPNPEDILYDADDPEEPADAMDKRDKDEEPAELQEQQLQVEE
ncbi:rab proteins geranylgeranyltransferase component A 1 isoform X1 [Hippocampus zosterae]|uniref:rab proteins geranylgeranyltransferase component A 1 isoform X1 n=1 Tax=Hippocampus zosterae TaxID=109293 RepID=UPI00223CD165|nr:rab proteins geranylgeranyltransferase component A 1 isoform X1 [Hippocampus zosterae]